MQTERLEREPICLVCPIINDRFSITLSAAADSILYNSFPKPASDAFAITKPWLQNCSGGSSLTLEAPEIKISSINATKLSFFSFVHLQMVTSLSESSTNESFIIQIIKYNFLLEENFCDKSKCIR